MASSAFEASTSEKDESVIPWAVKRTYQSLSIKIIHESIYNIGYLHQVYYNYNNNNSYNNNNNNNNNNNKKKLRCQNTNMPTWIAPSSGHRLRTEHLHTHIISTLAMQLHQPRRQGKLTGKHTTRVTYMDVSKNRDTPKWMVYTGKPYENGWFGGTIIFGNIHIPCSETNISPPNSKGVRKIMDSTKSALFL